VEQGWNKVERQPLSIRKFGEVCGVSHTEVQRKMKELGVEGSPQGKGLPTLLSPDEQDRIAQALFVPVGAPSTAQSVDVVGAGINLYTPQPLSLRGSSGQLSRNVQTMRLSTAISGFKGNQGGFREALIAMAAENGRQLGHDMAAVEMSEALATHQDLQNQMGKQLGVIEDAPETSSNA
jgi:hypothetical protein